MRWAELFADLESQLEQADAAVLAAEVADRSRHESGRLRLLDRLRPAVGADLRVTAAGAGPLAGRLTEVGAEWLLLEERAGQDALVPLSAVLAVAGLGGWSAQPDQEGRVFRRLGLTTALRGLARDRVGVEVWLRDAGTVTGTVDRVGADFVEVAEHPPGEPRRRDQVRSWRLVTLAAVGAVRSC